MRTIKRECLNKDKGIFTSMKEDSTKYSTTLLMGRKAVITTFLDRDSALRQMRSYRKLYKEIKSEAK